MRARCLVLVAALVSGCGGGSATAPDPTPVAEATPTPAAPSEPGPPTGPPPEPTFTPTGPAPLSPEETRDAWIAAQESGDLGWALTFVAEDQQQAFEQATEDMTEDDLIASGLQFRQEDYQLDFADEHLAVFWSDNARLYMAMVRERDGRWRLDPRRTDELNLEAAAARGGEAGDP